MVWPSRMKWLQISARDGGRKKKVGTQLARRPLDGETDARINRQKKTLGAKFEIAKFKINCQFNRARARPHITRINIHIHIRNLNKNVFFSKFHK